MRLRILSLTAALVASITVPAATAHQAPPDERPAPERPAGVHGVGPGWYLAQIDRGRRTEYGIDATRQRLVLVGPDGQRRRVLDRRAGFRLVDWSRDGGTALLLAQKDGDRRALRVDVRTGRTHVVPLAASLAEAVLAPDGTGILGVGFERGRTGRAPLFTLGWSGRRSALAPDVGGPVLPSPDGSVLVTGGQGWRAKVLRVLSADSGSVERRIRTAGHCTPVRWWDDARVLARCAVRFRAPSLALVDVEKGTVRALTGRRHHQRQDLGHLDARRTSHGLYVEVGGPCGYVYLGRRHRDGRVTEVRLPHAVGNVFLVDGSRRHLVLEHAISCDGAAPRSALTRYASASGREKVLAVLPRREAFGVVLPYGERRPTGL